MRLVLVLAIGVAACSKSTHTGSAIPSADSSIIDDNTPAAGRRGTTGVGTQGDGPGADGIQPGSSAADGPQSDSPHAITQLDAAQPDGGTPPQNARDAAATASTDGTRDAASDPPPNLPRDLGPDYTDRQRVAMALQFTVGVDDGVKACGGHPFGSSCGGVTFHGEYGFTGSGFSGACLNTNGQLACCWGCYDGAGNCRPGSDDTACGLGGDPCRNCAVVSTVCKLDPKFTFPHLVCATP